MPDPKKNLTISVLRDDEAVCATAGCEEPAKGISRSTGLPTCGDAWCESEYN